MRIERKKAVAVCEAVGLKAASDWDDKKLAKKMLDIPNLKNVEKAKGKLVDKELKNLLNAILALDPDEGTINIIGGASTNGKVSKSKVKDDDDDDDDDDDSDDDEDEEVETDDEDVEEEDDEDDEPAPKKKGAKGKKDKGAKKGKKTRESTVEKDKWGNRVGTRTANINKALMTGKALTVKEIEKMAKARSIHSHIYKLLGLGRIVKTKDGKFKSKK